MNRETNNIWKEVAVFILDNRVRVIEFMNQNGYSNLPINSTLGEVNEAFVDNLNNQKFIDKFSLFMQDDYLIDEGYSYAVDTIAQVPGFAETATGATAGSATSINPAIAIAKAISMIVTSVATAMIDAKNATFLRLQQLRQDLSNKEFEDWQKEQLELQWKKEMSLKLLTEQQNAIINRDAKLQREKTIKNFAIFGVFLVGALAVTYMVVKIKKTNK